MGFIVGLAFNIVLLGIPIGATLGTLLAIKPFRGDREELPVDQSLLVNTAICEVWHEFAQNKDGFNYTINSNEILAAPNSQLCLSMTTFANSTYSTNSTAPSFSTTWAYPFTAADTTSPQNGTKPLIHAFPQALLSSNSPKNPNNSTLPIPLTDLGALNLKFHWTMGIGSDPAPSTSYIRLGSQEVNASVALDMYLDEDVTASMDPGKAAFEVLILFAKLGLQDPVGFGNGSTVVKTETVGGVEFSLFAGTNAAKQTVYTWLATDPTDTFEADITPFFDNIFSLRDGVVPSGSTSNVKKPFKFPVPSFAEILGSVGFGTQAFGAKGPVTFSVPVLEIDVRTFGG